MSRNRIERPVEEPYHEFKTFEVACGTTKKRLVEGDYRGYRAKLIAKASNEGKVTIGKENAESIVFPVLETAYLTIETDIDKIYCIGTNAGDVLCVLLERA